MDQEQTRRSFTPMNQVPTSKPVAPQIENDYLPEIELKSVERLPSQGKSYPKDTQVRYKPYSFGEIKQISSSKLGLKSAYEKILSGVEVVGMDKSLLTLADTMYLGLLRKISTLGSNDVEVKVKCQSCGEQLSKVIQSDRLEFDDLPAPALPVKAELEIGKVEFMPITISQYYQMVDEEKTGDSIYHYALMANMDTEKAYKLFYRVGTRDGRILTKIEKALYHGVTPIEKKCTKKECGFINRIELDGGQALLLPFRRDQESIDDAISYGVEA